MTFKEAENFGAILKDEKIQEDFLKRVPEFDFYIYIPICTVCDRDISKDQIWYVGVDDTKIPFEFCQACKDNAIAIRIRREQTAER